MSCGCIPIVSDIPSFRMLTNRGKFGRLFATGDPADLARVALSVTRSEQPRLSAAIRDHFHRELSFTAMARQIDTIYSDLRPDLALSNKKREFADDFSSR
jgi:glycosyltransferase involved in cell wall biosynthesis